MSIESVLGKEIEAERKRSERLEDEVMRLTLLLNEFAEHHTYEPSINACIRDVKAYLDKLKQRRSPKT